MDIGTDGARIGERQSGFKANARRSIVEC
jgi:hypothetical protein